MEDKDALIVRLQKEVTTRDHDIHRAATYGNQLLEEKAILSSQIDELHALNERLEQEKHSVQLDLETKIQTVNAQSNELELLREEVDTLNEKIGVNGKEYEAFHKKNENVIKENHYLKRVQDDLNVEISSLKEQINVLTKQINNFKDQAERSIYETDKDDNQELQEQLSVYMLNNKELQSALSHCQSELESTKKNENHLLQMVREFEETILEKNAEISTYQEEIKIAKQEMEDLQGEIEILKFDQIDVKKRGNSVFAELDDRRTLVEKEYKMLRKKYDQLEKDYDTNKKELDKARGHIFSLQSSTSRENQQTYIDALEDSLSSSKREVTELMFKLSKALKANEEKNAIDWKSHINDYDYLKVMLQQSQTKEKEVKAEVMQLKSKNIYDNDKLIKMQHKVYKAREDLDSANLQIAKLQLQIKDLEKGIMHKLPEPVCKVPKIEFADGFEAPTADKKDLLNKSTFNDLPDLDLIPAELELGEEGFRQVRPSRKSNKFILKEFNRVDDSNNQECQDVLEKNAVCQTIDINASQRVTVQKSSSKPSRRRNENCAQQ